MVFASVIFAFYHQTKIPNGVWCRQRLNSRSLIQQLETLSIELTETHHIISIDNSHSYLHA